MMLHRYWFRVEYRVANSERIITDGLGVTSDSVEHASQLLKQDVFEGKGLPKILEVISDIDVLQLDPNNVIPNVGAPEREGVWYPCLNFSYDELTIIQKVRLYFLLQMFYPWFGWWKRIHPSILIFNTLARIRQHGRGRK